MGTEVRKWMGKTGIERGRRRGGKEWKEEAGMEIEGDRTEGR